MNADLQGRGMTSQRARDRLVSQLRTMGITAEPVLEAIRSIPRHVFIDEALNSRAYENTALPIGYGQTISQPYIVAKMTEILWQTGPLTTVLEVGTGCGYQTAVLAALADKVYSVERIEAFSMQARERLAALKYRNIRIRHGDGYQGWQQYAPYDGILVAAAAMEVPAQLLQQLNTGGRLVIPIGAQTGKQDLLLIRRFDSGYREEHIEIVSFVPMLTGLA